jgi:hypothetical protein
MALFAQTMLQIAVELAGHVTATTVMGSQLNVLRVPADG